jgi:hypothetical protein
MLAWFLLSHRNRDEEKGMKRERRKKNQMRDETHVYSDRKRSANEHE